MTKHHASLRLFNAVVAGKTNKNAVPFVDYENGVLIHPSARYADAEIREYIKETRLSGADLNKTFYSTWEKVRTDDLDERLAEQITHYFSTYGMASVGLYDPKMVYIPASGEKNIPENKYGLLVIKAVPADDLILACMSMLSSGAALKQETIEDILAVLDECGYKFTGTETIKNREAQVMIADRTGVLPRHGDDLMRYFVYKATGDTLLIKNRHMYEKIKSSGFALPALDGHQTIGLAASFNRMKPLMLAFRAANKSNRSLVNSISRLSKEHHRRVPANVLGSLTGSKFSSKKIRQAAEKAPLFQVVRSLNAVRYYDCGTTSRFYRVRNGRGWATNLDKAPIVKSDTAHDVLMQNIKDRVGKKTVFIPPGIDYAVPTSEKQFTGNIPKGSCITAPVDPAGYLMFGIHWGDANSTDSWDRNVDLDLSAIQMYGGKIGWNSHWRGSDGEILYSGDITNSSGGATEWMYTNKEIDDPYLICVNLYAGPDDHPYKLMVAYGTKEPTGNYMVDPNNVLFQADCKMTQKQMVVGMISPTADGNIKFTLIDQGMGSLRVSKTGDSEVNVMQTVLEQNETAIRLRDIVKTVDDPAKSTHDLSLMTLDKNSIMNVFTSTENDPVTV